MNGKGNLSQARLWRGGSRQAGVAPAAIRHAGAEAETLF